MSCEACIEARAANGKGVAYRWKDARIGIVACDRHLSEVLAALNRAQEKRDE